MLFLIYCCMSLPTLTNTATGGYPSQRDSNAENVSIWWRYHVDKAGIAVDQASFPYLLCWRHCYYSKLPIRYFELYSFKCDRSWYKHCLHLSNMDVICIGSTAFRWSEIQIPQNINERRQALPRLCNSFEDRPQADGIYGTGALNESWWRHQMEIFSALLAICAGNSPVTGEFPSQRPVTRSFDVVFDLCLNKRLSKQSWGWWFETPTCPLWRHCNGCTDLT